MSTEKRILVWTDIHKRDKDFNSIKGFVKATEKVHEDLCTELETGKYYGTISTGDVHHGGYRSPAYQHSHRNRHQRMKEAVNGNYFVCLGNHFYLERDQNPMMYLIQPHPTIKPLTDFYAKEPVIQAKDYIIVDGVQISFHHYHKDNKEYVRKREPGVRVHVAIFHDDTPMPQSVRDGMHQRVKVESSYLARVYDDVDLAIFGHVHNKIGTKVLELPNGKKVPILIPGSLGITSSDIDQRHRSVLCPVLVISESGLGIEYYEQSTHIELMKFYANQGSLEQGVHHTEVQHTGADRNVLGSMETKKMMDSHLDVVSYLRERGYKNKTIQLVQTASEGALSVTGAMELYAKEEAV